ncbi:type I polyketide synthase [Allokutzneria sp. NRRL B-24872]|uniref:type I polyketide synthase n=1 Tax=Allokutzneria sp. NRRL B-24872 TaxID=1137961 RepID=UPI000A37BA3E|nr:type I polyketide synthase [Allokutzneria sp. NRRL B-24872]
MANDDKLRDYLKRVMVDLRQTRRQLDELESKDTEPIAIVGMACRYPGGVASPEQLWDLVSSGRDAVSGFPADRGWDLEGIYDPDPDRAGRTYTRHGGFLDDAAGFDPAFFGISPREALAMDPQQRLLLQTSWEAIERAGIDPMSVRGGQAGVFVGTNGQDHASLLRSGDEETEAHALTANTAAVISGRIAYALGLEGPAVTVDTACSSSLVAMHLAAHALRQGECSLALAGGATIMATPNTFIAFSRQRGLSSDGRCRAFSASADGTGMAEGVGVILLERLSDARRNGHPVLAVIRGSAVNQDGASNGLTAPNGPSQERVIRQALANARLTPEQVDVVEAHGTATALGDPIEADALLATYGQDHPADRPLWLGSIKSNIGHSQAAAGVAGVIKMVMALQHGVLPRTLHVDAPSPHVDWASGNVRLLTSAEPWPDVDRPRRAGVSSFGASGTNAHVILEQAVAEPAPVASPAAGPVAWVLSGKSDAALRAQAARLLSFVDTSASPVDVALSLATTRSAWERRAAVVGSSVEELTEGLRAVAAGEGSALAVEGVARSGKVGFVFSGQGSQRLGMGQELFDTYPVFAAAFTEVVNYLTVDVKSPDLDQTGNAQPALFALEVALFRLLESWGVRPDVVAGHSIGEIAAAHVAGVLSLKDAAALVGARARLMQALPVGGAMVAVQASEAEVLPLLTDGVGIAAINGPESVVVSGTEDAVLAVVAQFAGRKTSRLKVSHAFHSPLMEPMLAEFASALSDLTFNEPQIPIVSTLTGSLVERCSVEYWVRHVRDSVRFADGVRAMREQGVTRFVEVGPGGVLSAMVQGCVDDAVAVPVLRAERAEPQAIVTALAQLHTHGVPVDWSVFGGAKVDLPTYAFQKERFWLDKPAPVVDAADAEFWASVEREDVASLATALGLSADELDAVVPKLSAWRRQRHEVSTVDSWTYRIDWQPLPEIKSAALAGNWVVVAEEGDERAAAVAEGLGARLVTDLAELTEADGILSFGSLTATVKLLRAGVEAPLWCATRGAVHDNLDPDQSMVWGLGRAVALEHPQRWGGLVDLGENVDVGRLAAVLNQTSEDQVVIRDNGVFAARLSRVQRGITEPWTPRGTVLITGGTGALAGHLARWLAKAGAEHLVLTSRRGMEAPGAAELKAELEASTEVTVLACDMADRDAVQNLLAEHTFTSVFHTAGVEQFTPFDELTDEDFARTLGAKVTGAALLDELLGERELDAFVLYSSIAATWGSGQQTAYAAANAYLDGLAHQRRARGLAATSVAWGPWGGGGMLTDSDEAQLSRRGVSAMRPDLAVSALRRALDSGETAIAVADVDWGRFIPPFTLNRPSALLSGFTEAAPAEENAAPLVAKLSGLSTEDQIAALLDIVRGQVAAVLGHRGADSVETDRAFKDLGFDSLTAIEMRTKVGAATGLSLPATLIFDYPNPLVLAEFLHAELFGSAAATTRVVTASADEPIAIVAMSCRLPGGVASPEALWQLVSEGVDAISGFPGDRGWDIDSLYDPDPERTGTTYARDGGFLADATDFDAAFFGISPREALAMDPQQRLLLEASWEVFERAGLTPAQVKGTRTGVYAGLAFQGYGTESGTKPDGVEGHLLTGGASSVASGRVAYTFGLEGPAVTIDTACSSSLVALHLAVQSLRSGESDMALAGGVCVMASPNVFVEFSRQRGLSPDGRCRAFSADADGTGWSEGVGMILVERLSDAQRFGHPVLAVVRGTAINQDGASNGLTAPNGPAQQRVIREALAAAGLAPSDVDTVEAHGTGTTLGDPIEAQALLATYGRDRDQPLWVGSLKSNIGHTQAAAGVAGVIKMVMAMRNGVLPQTLHAGEPTPHVDWSAGNVRLLTESVPWQVDRPRRAGISSFGASGTNAHAIIEQAPPGEAPRTTPEPTAPVPWVLSAKSAKALRAQAARLAEHLTDRDWNPIDIGFSLDGRAAFEERAVVVGTDRESLLEGLQAFTVTGTATTKGKAVFVFPGQGSQWQGMAVELLETSPVFRERIAKCEQALEPFVDWSLTEVLRGVEGAPTTDRVDVVQPVLWAVMVSLAELWRSFGVEPAAVIGHSQGEIAAAAVSGALSLSDAARVVSLRSKALLELSGLGGMVSVALPLADTTALISQWDGRIGIAAVNGPATTVVSGDADALDELMVVSEQRDARARRVNVDYASHSAHVERIEQRLAEVLAPIVPRSGGVPFYSTVTGALIDTGEVDAEYWYRNLRQTVLMREAVEAAITDGHDVFVESSPHPVMIMALEDTIEASEATAAVVPSLRRDQGGLDRFTLSLGQAYVHGVVVDWSSLLPGKQIELPTYAFQRERFWFEPASATVAAAPVDEVESGFWESVEREDLDSIAETLGVGADESLSAILPRLSAWRRSRREQSVVDSWRYRVTWKPLTTAPAELSGTWIVVATEETEWVSAVRSALSGELVIIDLAADRAALAAQLRELGPVNGIVSLLADDAGVSVQHKDLTQGIASTVLLVQALGDAEIDAPLWCATRTAVAVGRSEHVEAPVQSQLWGFGRVVALEHPRRWGGMIDLPSNIDARVAGRLLAVLSQSSEDQVAVRASGAFGRRLVRAKSSSDSPQWTPRGTVLITGGTGALGGHVARWLAEAGAEHLVLTSRRGIDAPGAAELSAELEALGANVTVAACDVTDRDSVAAVLAAHPVNAVVHAAGIDSHAMIEDTTLDEFADTLSAKVAGAVHLHELLGDQELDAFILFSSGAGIWGSGRQGAYSAGNAFMDALVEHRRSRGLAGLAISWGAWADGGMAAQGDAEEILRRRGVHTMPAAMALSALRQALSDGETTLTVAAFDWALFAPRFTVNRASALLDELPEVRRALESGDEETTAAGPTPLVAKLSALTAGEQDRLLVDLVRTQAATVLGHNGATEVEAGRAFKELGFDSLTAVELRNKLNAATGLKLPTTAVFDYPNALALASFLRSELSGTREVAAASTVTVTDEPIAIVGMACRFPGGANSPEELWQLLESGTDVISLWPDDRGWDTEGMYDPEPGKPGKTYARDGGFLYDAAGFDAGLFGISPREALAMDPQQRLLLESSWEVFERAGIDPMSLKGSQTGVFVGMAYQGYGAGLAEVPEGVEGHLLTGGASSVVSGRVAYTFGLEGPAVTVDTACSSSLVALHLAMQSLRSGESTMAIAGGVNVMAGLTGFVEFSRQRGLSPDGRCKAFAESADGTGWADGVGLVLVERLSDAQRNGHKVLAVVRGSAVNQDGASNGLTAPNGPAQQRVIRQALASAGLVPSDVDAVEAHGTGTKLGDPIEAQALLATYGQERQAPLWLGTLKSNIGHSQAAAGVAGVIKMVMALRNDLLPKTLHVDEPTSHVDWSTGDVRLLTEAQPWPSNDRPRRAGISSFGVSGTNAHVIVEEYTCDAVSARVGRPGAGVPLDTVEEAPAVLPVAPASAPAEVAWVLSGKTSAAVRDQASRLLSIVDDVPSLDVARVLATGRAALEHRAAVVGSDRDSLVEGLHALVAGTPNSGVTVGRADNAGNVAFLFSGQGSQRAGMGCELYEAFPAFAAAFDDACAHVDVHGDRPLRDVVFGDSSDLGRTEFTQPALFALEVALFRLLESWGVRPDVVTGHSIGEIAAAHVAGALSLADAAKLVSARAQLMQALPAGGAMVAIQATEAEVLPHLDDAVSIAAINGPESVVVSGAEDAVLAVAAQFTDRKTSRLKVSHAFHSPLMEPMLAEFEKALDGIEFQVPGIPIVSASTGSVVERYSVAYWVRHVRDAVRFAEALDTVHAQGVNRFVEIGPGGVLTAMAQGCLADVVTVALLRSDRPETQSITTAVAQLHAHGVAVDWSAVYPGAGVVDLPTYPFQHERYWLMPSAPVVVSEDGGFWDTVEQADVTSLAETLDLPAEQLEAVLPRLSAWRRQRRDESTVDNWTYRVDWKPLRGLNAQPYGTWIVLATEETEWTTAVTDGLAARGLRVYPIAVETTADRSAITRQLVRASEETLVAGVVSLLGVDERPHAALSVGAALSVLLVQALGDADIQAPLWTVTAEAMPVGGVVPSAVQNAIWGFGRVAALEHSRRWGGLIDLPGVLSEGVLGHLVGVLGQSAEDQVVIRENGVHGRRLARLSTKDGSQWTPRGTVLITGGTGALGGHVGRWLASAGAEHLVLTSRRGLDAPGAAELKTELEALGARVTVAACDVADRDAVAALLAEHPVNAVVHTAGVDQLEPLADMDLESFADVLSAKVGGAVHLHELAGDLDAFVLFSSIAGVWGGGHQAAYAAANAFLDGLAERRRAQGLAATAVAWGPWDDGGMAEGEEAGQRLSRRGLVRMRAALAVSAMRRVIGVPAATVVDVDWERFIAPFTVSRSSALLSDLVSVKQAEPELVSSPLVNLTEAELVELVRTHASAVLGYADSGAVEAGRAFKDLGFDSLTAVELRNQLTAATGLTLPPTLVFDYPNALALAAHLRSELSGTREVTSASAVTVTDEPIAIVGMACRYPGGVDSPEDLWNLVASGTDGISEFPEDRGWDVANLYDSNPDSSGKSYVKHGGFRYDAAEFDAAFFGISPREATVMDPQQRLLLETAWETFERAGLDPEMVRGTQTGVFVGSGYQDYAAQAFSAADDSEGFFGTGNTASIMSGRIAYTFGLEGPAVTIDTACSSSLVALHWAVQALRNGECSMALAGGVMIMATPRAFVEFSRQRGLAEDGRCKAFAAAADGTGWSEGIGMLLVERLSDAQRNGHKVLAVVRGSAVNQDGASNGLTAPNGPAQQRVIRQALASAGLAPSDVDAVEAHGTGTRLGDPIEAQAVLATYGQDRAQPLWLGSLKSNIGHTQAAAGVGGVIKMVMAMRNGVLPKTLHIDAPTPNVDWSAGAVSLLTEAVPWESGRPRRAGISSFGVSGTNSHVIIEEAPASEDGVGAPGDAVVPWVLSGKSEAAVRDQARRLLSFVDDQHPVDVGLSLASTRSALGHRAAVVGVSREELLEGLRAVASGGSAPGVVRGRPGGKIGFVFSGQGSQRVGMGQELFDTYPVFAAAWTEVVNYLTVDVKSPDLDQTGNAQPALFALEVALFRLLESWGVRPDVLAGHSIGEIAAAHVAGVLSLEDAATLVSARARLMQALPSGGAMVAVQASEDEVLPLLTDGVGIAAINGPESVVVSGAEDAVLAVAAQFTDRKTSRLKVSHAFHSPLMEPMLAEFAAAIEGITFNEPEIPVVSTLTGSLVERYSAGYWVRHVRDSVRFADAVETVRDRGVTTFVEVGPGGVLSALVQGCLTDVVTVPVLRADRPEPEAITTALAEAHARGATVDWTKFFVGGSKIDLPTYAFQRERYWLDAPEPVAGDAVDSDFWETVEREDLASLTATLEIGENDSFRDVLPRLSSWRKQRREESVVDGLRYGITWKRLGDGDTTASGLWLVPVPSALADDAWVQDCLLGLTDHGITPVPVPIDAGTNRALATKALAEAAHDHMVTGVLSLLGVDSDGPALSLVLVQALGDAQIDAPLWLATRNAMPVNASDELENPAQSQVWGIGMVTALEHASRWGGLVDLPAKLDERVTKRLASVLGQATEDQIAVRASGSFGRRLGAVSTQDGAQWTPRGTVLITGGTGALGGHVARWLAGAGAEHVILTSRRGLDAPGATELKAELESLGAQVTVAACDVADRDAVRSLLAEHTVNAVVHTAGGSDAAMLMDTTPAEFAEMSAAKVAGAVHLDELLADKELDAFVLFSSISGVWGGGGQAAYSAANAFLNGLAENRRHRGLAATSIAWGPWAGGGMVEATGDEERLKARGLTALRPEQAITALRRALDGGDTAVAIADVDWEKFIVPFTVSRESALLGDLPQVKRVEPQAPEVDASALVAKLSGMSESDQERTLIGIVSTHVATVLGHRGTAAVEADLAFKELGFDSLTAVELRNLLTGETGLTLPATLVFDHPTPRALARHLREALLDTAGGEVSVFEELDRLESLIAGVNQEEVTRSRVRTRLQGLLVALSAPAVENGELEAATVDDIFDLIDQELEIS